MGTSHQTKRESGARIPVKIDITEEALAALVLYEIEDVQGVMVPRKKRLFERAGWQIASALRVDIGEEEVALDIDIIVVLGTNLREVSDAIRARLAAIILRMMNRHVVEVNFRVVDLHVDDVDRGRSPEKEEALPRVR